MAHGKYILKETLISALVSIALSAAVYSITFNRFEMVPFWSLSGYVPDFLAQGFGVGFMSVLVPGLVTTRRISKGCLEYPSEGRPRVGRSILMRAILTGILSMIGLFLIAALFASLSGWSEIRFELGLLYKILVGAGLALIVTPTQLRVLFRAYDAKMT